MKIDEPIWALGAMSGTSLDGVDAALVKTDGETIHEFGRHAYRPYSDDERAILRAALGKWPDEEGVKAATEVVEIAHAELLATFPNAQLVGFHGQTLAHDPKARKSHQIGDGAVLAEFLGKPVVWDFRSADLALGGQGAPLAPFFHHACTRYLQLDHPVAILNLGGVGNITFIDPSLKSCDVESAVLAFDTGPANAPLNDLIQRRLGEEFDKNGAVALEGDVHASVVGQFLENSYFLKMPPKSLDRNDFQDLMAVVENLTTADALATLGACVSGAVGRGMEHAPSQPTRVFVTGGGRNNNFLMRKLSEDLGVDVENIDDTGLNGDMLEAQAFAYLAVRVARGLTTSCPPTTGVSASVGGGVLSDPRD